MGASPEVLIVDDHALLAQSLLIALRAEGMSAERCTDLRADAILAEVERLAPKVVLLDLDVGGDLGDTIELIEPISRAGARVVMVTGITDRARLAACVEAGAIGVIGKARPFESLLEGVKDAVRLGTLLTQRQRDELLGELRRQRAEDRERMSPFDQLTRREADVLAGLIDGQSAEQIAASSYVSLTTVRSQIRSVLQKLGVKSQLAAVAMARKAGWTPPDRR